jgi:hypothetical protein
MTAATRRWLCRYWVTPPRAERGTRSAAPHQGLPRVAPTNFSRVGANHNFFNAEWTPGHGVAPSGDDWTGPADEPACGTDAPGRLAPAEQRAVLATHAAAFVGVHLARRTDWQPLLDGSGSRVGSTGRRRLHVPAAALLGQPRLDQQLQPGARASKGGSATSRTAPASIQISLAHPLMPAGYADVAVVRA